MEMSRTISSVSPQVTNEAILFMYSKAEVEAKREKMRKREHLISCIHLRLLGVWLDGGGSRETDRLQLQQEGRRRGWRGVGMR